MGTRSYIGYKDSDCVKYVYCHWDGYLNGVGRELFYNYRTLDSVKKLISGGSLSFIGPTYEECCYYRDRPKNIMTVGNIEEYNDGMVSFFYLFLDDKWFWSTYKDKNFYQLVFFK
jgi:hypothetical protein